MALEPGLAAHSADAVSKRVSLESHPQKGCPLSLSIKEVTISKEASSKAPAACHSSKLQMKGRSIFQKQPLI
jgi:hypothetical protein